MKRRTLAIAAALVLLAATPASAHESSSTSKHEYTAQSISVTGGSATCDLQSWKNVSYLTKDNIVDLICWITDSNSTDGVGMKVVWRYDGFASITSPSYYSGTNTYNPPAYGGGDSIGTVYFRLCRVKQFLPDTCSSEKSWSVLH